MLAGADEAGRGPVLGPLVVAAVAGPGEAELRRLGARDSKTMTPAQREEVAQVLKGCARWEVRVLSAEELNRGMATRNLNELEAQAFAEVLAALAPERAIVDACDVDEARFAASVARRLPPPGFPVLAEHGADVNHAVVGAASVIAKVTRDALVRDIERELGTPVGSGYPSDPVTRAFLERWRRDHGALPPHTRVYWSTVAGDRPLDRRLGDF